MRLARSLDSRHLPPAGCVLTIGNFDGVHRGHRRILEHVVAEGRRRGLPAVVMTFLPGPEEYFRPDAAAPRLTTVASRYFALAESGVDVMLALPFNRRLAATRAEEFIEGFVVERLQAKYVLVGDDFRFGQGRQGDFAVMQAAGRRFGFAVERFNTVRDDDCRISSTRVRELLAAGRLDEAAQLLGRPFTLAGRVGHGDRRGRTIGFPTLNLPVRRPPVTGVFAVRVAGTGLAERVDGVANLGHRPTVGGEKTLLEVHLFDVDAALYGRRVCVEFVARIRAERRFDSVDALRAQIGRDCARAREILARDRR